MFKLIIPYIDFTYNYVKEPGTGVKSVTRFIIKVTEILT